MLMSESFLFQLCVWLLLFHHHLHNRDLTPGIHFPRTAELRTRRQ